MHVCYVRIFVFIFYYMTLTAHYISCHEVMKCRQLFTTRIFIMSWLQEQLYIIRNYALTKNLVVRSYIDITNFFTPISSAMQKDWECVGVVTMIWTLKGSIWSKMDTTPTLLMIGDCHFSFTSKEGGSSMELWFPFWIQRVQQAYFAVSNFFLWICHDSFH